MFNGNKSRTIVAAYNALPIFLAKKHSTNNSVVVAFIVAIVIVVVIIKVVEDEFEARW